MSVVEPDPVPPVLTPRLWVRAAMFGMAYFACAALGSALSLRPGPFVTLWLPSGLFVATLLIHERRHWPIFILVACLANTGFDLSNGQALHISLLFFSGNTLEAITGAWLVQRFVAEKPTLETLGEVAGFTACSALVSTLLSASIGAGVVAHLLKGGTFWSTFLLWWSGDVLGIFLLSPLILTWRNRFHWPTHRRWSSRSTEEAVFMVVLCLGAIFVFRDPWHPDLSLKYLIPAVVLGAFRYGLRGTTLASLIVAVIAAWTTQHGHNDISMSGVPLREQAIALQLFLAVVASGGLIPAALLSEQKAAEEKLVEAHEFSSQIIQSAREGIIVYGSDLRYRVWNPFMEQLSGFPACEVLGKHPAEVFPFLRGAGVLDRLERALAGEAVESLDFPFHLPNQGKSGWTSDSSAPFRNAKGEIIGVIGTVTDITERKLAEEALRESEYFFKESQRAGRIGSYRADFVGGLWVSSEVLDEIFGIGPTYDRSIPGWLAIIHPEDREMMARHLMEDVGGRRGPFDKEYRIIRRSDDETRWVHGLGEAEFDGEGTLTSLFGTIMDVTERRRAEEEKARLQTQLMQAQKMESLGSLAGGVAHDMNNVLGAILGMATANIQAQPEGSPGYRAFDTIIQAATRGGKMVKSLLTFARQSPAEELEVDINEVLRGEVRMLERTTLAKVRLVLDLSSDLRVIRGDAGALTHAFMNLCVNAVDAMPDNGSLTLRTRNVDEGWVEVQVEDTGSGMSKEVLEKALDPFFTTKEIGKGTGLGLPMVYRTVKAHHGQMEIFSEPGRGTRVTMRFPVCKIVSAPTEPLAEPQPEAPKAALTVLVVDDDELIQSAMLPLIEILGHRAVGVSSGEEALERLEAGFQADVVILDINMPGLGGAGTLPRLRQLRPTTPVLLATGRVDQFASDLAGAHPFVSLLSKPFSLKELQQKLDLQGRN